MARFILSYPLAAGGGTWQDTDVPDPIEKRMPVRFKKLIGVVVLLALVIVYAVFATAFASLYLGNAPGWLQLAYFLGTGLFWIVPAMFVISWMQREPRSRSQDVS